MERVDVWKGLPIYITLWSQPPSSLFCVAAKAFDTLRADSQPIHTSALARGEELIPDRWKYIAES